MKVVNDILCRRFEDSSIDHSHLQQVVPSTLRPQILESIHCSATAAYLGVKKISEKLRTRGVKKFSEKLRTRFYWPGDKKDISVFVSGCTLCQQRNSSKQQHRHSLVNRPVSFTFRHIGIEFLGPPLVSIGNPYKAFFGDHFTKWNEAVPLPDKTAERTTTALLEA